MTMAEAKIAGANKRKKELTDEVNVLQKKKKNIGSQIVHYLVHEHWFLTLLQYWFVRLCCLNVSVTGVWYRQNAFMEEIYLNCFLLGWRQKYLKLKFPDKGEKSMLSFTIQSKVLQSTSRWLFAMSISQSALWM